MINRKQFRRLLYHKVIVILSFLFMIHHINAQDMSILRARGKVAVISAGSASGIRVGDTFRVYRLQNNASQEITTVEVTHVQSNIARVVVADSAPQMELQRGDRIEKIELTEGSTRSAPESQGQMQRRTPQRQTIRRSLGTEVQKKVYLGPTLGIFIPLGDLADSFDTAFGYGGIVGLQFRSDLDVSMRFFYTAKKNEWSLWNLQLLGRRYSNRNLLVDFGYGISYPQTVGSGNIALGFIGGFGYRFPIALSTFGEIGCLFHYYPHFASESGQFITIQGRLIL